MILLLANIAYFLMLCAFITRDALRLRVLLVFAQSLIAAYAWISGVPVIAAWNALLVVINTVMSIRIVTERRAVVLPPDLQRLYDRHFAALSPPEFLRWWRQGRREVIDNQHLTRAGERPDWLYFLLEGKVRVSREEQAIVELPPGYFVAEMSLLTGEPANADVHAVGPVDVIRWTTDDLRSLRQRNPTLWTKIQSVIGHDLVEKLRLEERAVAEAADGLSNQDSTAFRLATPGGPEGPHYARSSVD